MTAVLSFLLAALVMLLGICVGALVSMTRVRDLEERNRSLSRWLDDQREREWDVDQDLLDADDLIWRLRGEIDDVDSDD